MVGLSMARVIQLAAMKIKIMKSNQSLEVTLPQNFLVAESSSKIKNEEFSFL